MWLTLLIGLAIGILGVLFTATWVTYLIAKEREALQPPTTYEEALDGLVAAKTIGEILYYRQYLRQFRD